MFWAGDVYAINARAFGRVASAVKETDLSIHMTSTKTLNELEAHGIETERIERVYYPDWSDYLAALQRHQILLLSLDWPDESPIHRIRFSPLVVGRMLWRFARERFRESDKGFLATLRSMNLERQRMRDAQGRVRGRRMRFFDRG